MKQRIKLHDGEIVAATRAGITAVYTTALDGTYVEYDDEQPLSSFVEFVLARRHMSEAKEQSRGIYTYELTAEDTAGDVVNAPPIDP